MSENIKVNFKMCKKNQTEIETETCLTNYKLESYRLLTVTFGCQMKRSQKFDPR